MLGKMLRCRITGFEGIATARVEYLNGCIQYCLKPKMVDSKMPEGEYIDVHRIWRRPHQLELVGDGLMFVVDPTGGEMKDTPSGEYRG